MILRQNFFFCIINIFLFFMGSSFLFGQNLKNGLDRKVSENGILFNQSVDKAFQNLDQLLKEAVDQKNHGAELILLDRKCRYFYSKNQIDDLLGTAEILNSKAASYNDHYYQAMANAYMAETYSINGLNDQAIKHLDKAYAILDHDGSGQKKIFLAKTNVLNSYANVYSDMGESRKAVQKLREIIKSSSELTSDAEVNQFQYVNYSNIANLYASYNYDSARYFALKSIELKPKGKKDDAVMMMNYYLLADALKHSSKDNEAILNYHRALKISSEIGFDLNTKKMYESLVELYRKNGRKDSAIVYENKLKQLEISILESKYNSLKKVIVEDRKNGKEMSLLWLYISIIVLLIIGASVFFYNQKQRKKYTQTPQQSYLLLTEMAKNNDPSFMFTFDSLFPNFSESLLKIDPDLQKSEIEFCALLKLNLSTKEISKITFIETRTVQNKKYKIRKKLKIPPSMDIYNWFSDK